MADADAIASIDVLGLDSAARGGRGAYSIEPTAGVVDQDPPTIGDFDPPTTEEVQPGGSVAFSLRDVAGLTIAAVFAYFEQRRLYEVVHDATAFGPEYDLSTRTTITNGWRYTLRRRSKWPRERLRIRVLARDAGGNAVVIE